MIFFKHKNPKAFNNLWRVRSQFATTFNFERYIYKILDKEFEKDDEAFREAVAQYEFMKNLTQ